MDVSTMSEAVDLIFSMVDDVNELVIRRKGDVLEDGPPLCPCGDVGKPVDVADDDGGEVIKGRVWRKDELGDHAAPVDQRRQQELSAGDRLEKAEDDLAVVEVADVEGEPPIAGANATSTLVLVQVDEVMGKDTAGASNKVEESVPGGRKQAACTREDGLKLEGAARGERNSGRAETFVV